MLRALARSAAAVVLSGGVLLAADFWEKKEFRDWSDKDVVKMTSNSPWAKRVTITMGGPGMGSSPGDVGQAGRAGISGNRGGSVGGGSSRSSGEFGGGRGGGGGGGGRSAPTLKLIVRWHSALPVKQALVRSNLGAEGGPLNDEMTKFLGREETHYIVSVSGLPSRLSRVAENPERLKQTAKLQRKNKEPIEPEKVEVQVSETAVDLYFLFPRSDPIELTDKDVELVMKLGGGPPPGAGGGEGEPQAQDGGQRGGGGRPIELKKKFKLKDMVYKDKLEL